VVTVFAAVVIVLIAQLARDRAINVFVWKDVAQVHEKQLADLKEAHRRHIAQLKNEHNVEAFRQHRELDSINARFNHLYAENDYMTSMYQDQMCSAQEQEDRIAYLETKLREAGQSTPARLVPFSAPASQINFANPPQRKRSHSFSKPPGSPSPLCQVVEAEEIEE
jgi:hypothetical protein